MLQIQVHIKIPKPPAGMTYAKSLMDEIAAQWLAGKPLPKSIKVTALEWRNSGIGENGRWMEARDPRKMEAVRRDFQAVADSGGLEFSGVQALGSNR